MINHGGVGYGTVQNLVQTAFYESTYGAKPRCALYYIGRADKGAQLGLYEIARSTHATSLAKRVAAFRRLI